MFSKTKRTRSSYAQSDFTLPPAYPTYPEVEVIECYKPVQIRIIRSSKGTIIQNVPDKSLMGGLHVLDCDGYLVEWNGTNHLSPSILLTPEEQHACDMEENE